MFEMANVAVWRENEEKKKTLLGQNYGELLSCEQGAAQSQLSQITNFRRPGRLRSPGFPSLQFEGSKPPVTAPWESQRVQADTHFSS